MVKARPGHARKGERSRSETVRHIRGILGRTQAELAHALGVSAKAVQSYEQGWRAVPTRLMIQLLVLLALYRRQTLDDVPCWEVTHCAASAREKCPSFTVGRGQFCWFIGSKASLPREAGELPSALPCMQCPVVQRLLQDPERPTARARSANDVV